MKGTDKNIPFGIRPTVLTDISYHFFTQRTKKTFSVQNEYAVWEVIRSNNSELIRVGCGVKLSFYRLTIK